MKQAYILVKQGSGFFSTASYAVLIEYNTIEDAYYLKVFKVVFEPNDKFGRFAKEAHYTRKFAKDDLYLFLQARDLDIDDGWWPLEPDNQLLKPHDSLRAKALEKIQIETEKGTVS